MKTKSRNEENRNLGLWPTWARNIQTEPNKEEQTAAADSILDAAYQPKEMETGNRTDSTVRDADQNPDHPQIHKKIEKNS
jgi:hypothetical protein